MAPLQSPQQQLEVRQEASPKKLLELTKVFFVISENPKGLL
jgi:hypothetical protein